jgi:hypothetical protein
MFSNVSMNYCNELVQAIWLAIVHDRSVLGVDPASGTTIDAFNGKTHKVPRTATSFASDNALVFAEDYVRSSAEFTAKAASPSAGDVIKLNTPLQDILALVISKMFGVSLVSDL